MKSPLCPRLLAAVVLLVSVQPALAQFQTVFLIGAEPDNNSQAEFEQENASLANYYWENGDYSVAGLGGVNWTTGMEPWINAAADLGFPRALTSGHLQTNIFFQLDATEAGPNQPLRLTLDLIGLKANTTHDLEARLNTNATPFWTATGIATNTLVTIDTTGGAAGARTGANKLILRRTGGQLDAGSAWIQFDDLKLEADPSAQFIQSFTSSDWLVRPGETPTLSWTVFDQTVSLSITPGIGNVDALTVNGAGSIVLDPAPASTTIYTLTATKAAVTQTRTTTVQVSPWDGLFEAGSDNNSHSDFSHEVAADDNYYFAGDYTSVGGPNQVQNEILNDDTNTDTPAGRTGNPSIGFERALTDADPEFTIWFIVPAAKATPISRLRVTVDLLNAVASGGVTGSTPPAIEISLNGRLVRTETNVTTPRLIQFETTGALGEIQAGPNVLKLRRIATTLNSYVTFDYLMLEWLPGSLPAVTSIVDDPILGTHTVFWDASPGKMYRVQKSADGTTWENLVINFPTGGSPGTTLFYEDRATPFADPRPQYRAVTE
ncbi:MAG: hypothetical protein ACR2OZ_12540 [Verrucomicrobiales bacterium]